MLPTAIDACRAIGPMDRQTGDNGGNDAVTGMNGSQLDIET